MSNSEQESLPGKREQEKNNQELPIIQKDGLSRRRFLRKGANVVGSIILGSVAPQFTPSALGKDTSHKIDIEWLRSKLTGSVLLSTEEGFKKSKHDLLWNQLQPKRSPDAIVKIADVNDIIKTVKFANGNKLKVAVRGGGHTWSAPAIRDGGLLIDLGNLNKIQSVDAKELIGVTQPVVSNEEAMSHLSKYNVAFPVGHCPGVKMSGYLLGGGMGWNMGAWGLATVNVKSLKIVTAEGEHITANKNENADYYWAAQGAGSGFFGIVTEYKLNLFPLPKIIQASTYFFPYAKVRETAQWVSQIAKKMPDNVELSMFLIKAPPELEEKCKDSNGKVVMVTASAFMDTQKDAQLALSLLEGGSVKPLMKSFNQSTDFQKLMNASGTVWKANMRNKVEAGWSNSSAEDLFGGVADHFKNAPSDKSCYVYVFNIGKDKDKLPDMAFSMMGDLYGGLWTMWDDPLNDKANIAWHNEGLKILKKFTKGHYIGETNFVDNPRNAKESFAASNWNKLRKLRQKYDPEGVFYDYHEGLG